jgi:O-methyltransferase
MARALPAGGKVITLDEDKRYIAEAEAFWKAMGVAKTIEFKLGLAETTLKGMAATKHAFDLVFIDADKENYKKYVESALKMTRKGGSILIDNTLWRGLVADQHATDNGAKHIRAFNAWLHEKFGKDAALLPAWDGLTLIVKK